MTEPPRQPPPSGLATRGAASSDAASDPSLLADQLHTSDQDARSDARPDSPQDDYPDDQDGPLGPPRWPLHVALWCAALASMILAGMSFAGQDPFTRQAWQQPLALGQALAYAACLITILSVHELGHWVGCRRHHVDASPPFFLPGLPIPSLGLIPLFGTFGAFIKMRVRPMSATALLQIGAWGPLAGFAVAAPVLIVGFMLSEVKPLPEDMSQTLQLGDSLLLWLLERAFFPDIPAGHDVYLHPVAMAGWVGAFFTGFNLVPLGQLDGGHIAYSALGQTFNRLAKPLWLALVALGVVLFPGWLLLAAFLFLSGVEHPDLVRGPTAPRRGGWLAAASLVIFVLTFTPAPFEGVGLLDALLKRG